MRRSRLFLSIGLLIFFALCLVPGAQAQYPCTQIGQGPVQTPWSVGLSCNFTAASGSTGGFNAAGISYWKVSFVPSGTVSAATLSLDSSATGLTSSWSTGGIIPAATIGSMTSSGTYGPAAGSTTTNFGRLTPSITGSGSVTVVLYGYVTNPSGGSGTVSSVGSGTGLTGGPITGSGTLALASALPNGETATTQAVTDQSTAVATDAYVANSALPSPGAVDLSLGYPGGSADPCLTAYNNTVTAIAANAQAIELYWGGFAKYFTNGIVPCLSNPWEKLFFSGKAWWGPIMIVSAVPWTTPGGNARFGIQGVGDSDPGNATIPPYGSMWRPCTAEAPGWNGTNCVIGSVTVPAYRGSGHSVTFTVPHPPFPAGTYWPGIYWGGGQTAGSGISSSGFYDSMIQDMTIDGGGPGGADISLYDTGGQEQTYLFHNTFRSANSACVFFDRVQGTTSGPSHFGGKMNDCRMSLNQTAAPGYPTVGSTPEGYGIWYQGNGLQISASGSCGSGTVYPQAYVSAVGGGGTTLTATFTYSGNCTVTPSCTVYENSGRGGTGATCTWTGGPPSTGVTINCSSCTGYSASDIAAEGPYEWSGGTINGTSSVGMEEAFVCEGCVNPTVGPVHAEWMSASGAAVHLGAGNGEVQGGEIIGASLANSGAESVHLGLGIDKNQILLDTFGVSGAINSILDDACLPGAPVSGSISVYDPCSFYVAAGSQNVTITGTMTLTGATPAITTANTNANLTLTPNGSGFVLGPAGTTTQCGWCFFGNTNTGVGIAASNVLGLLSNGVTVAQVTGGLELSPSGAFKWGQTGGSSGGTAGASIGVVGSSTTEAISQGTANNTGLFIFPDCKLLSGVSMTVSGTVYTVCSLSLPNSSVNVFFDCNGTYTTTTSADTLSIGWKIAQAPTDVFGSALIGSVSGSNSATVTQVFTGSGSNTSATAAANEVMAVSSSVSTVTNVPWSAWGVIDASSATAGTFLITAVLTGTSPSGTINAGTICLFH